MQLERLISFFDSSPAIRLLRSTHAPYIVYFLEHQFKESGEITWAHSALLARLAEFQSRLRQEGNAETLRDRTETYLNDWAGGQSRWLVRRLEGAVSEPVYELSVHAEQVLKFLREILGQRLGFVGTESRLRRIIDTLSNIVVRGNDDPQRRLDFLRQEKARIDAEIESIEQAGVVTTYSPTAIRERFADAVSDLVQLQSDFRSVEESFKDITRKVQRRQAAASGSRGEILGYALDAEDNLQNNDQGISFQEFVRLVLSPAKQEELEEMIVRLSSMAELVDSSDGLRRMRGMVPALLIEAQKVLKTTQRLSTSLRRVLDTRSAAGRQRLADVLREIRQLANRAAENHSVGQAELLKHIGVQIDSELDLTCLSERTFWAPHLNFQQPAMKDEQYDEDDRMAAFKSLAHMQRLDWSGLRKTISISLAHRTSLTLTELLAEHPPQTGVIEVLGYLQIAHDDGHLVSTEVTDTIRISVESLNRQLAFDLPRVTFLKPNSSAAESV